MKFSDLKGVFKKSFPRFESVDNPHSDYYVVSLKPEPGFTWAAGEHSIFWLPDNEVEGSKNRAFSVASIPQEGSLILGFRTGENISSFKKEMINMKPGDRVGMRGPFGWFKFKNSHSPAVMIGAGVGIVPIRSLLKEIENNTDREVHVVYTSREFHLFGDELEALIHENPKITLHKKHHREETQAQIAELAQEFGNDAYYFICGTPSMTESTKEHLETLGIEAKRMINDPFKGYK